eukprot:366154-Chlamydomonas_euryale.AAC.3
MWQASVTCMYACIHDALVPRVHAVMEFISDMHARVRNRHARIHHASTHVHPHVCVHVHRVRGILPGGRAPGPSCHAGTILPCGHYQAGTILPGGRAQQSYIDVQCSLCSPCWLHCLQSVRHACKHAHGSIRPACSAAVPPFGQTARFGGPSVLRRRRRQAACAGGGAATAGAALGLAAEPHNPMHDPPRAPAVEPAPSVRSSVRPSRHLLCIYPAPSETPVSLSRRAPRPQNALTAKHVVPVELVHVAGRGRRAGGGAEVAPAAAIGRPLRGGGPDAPA